MRQIWIAFRCFFLLTLVTGVFYPALVTLCAQALFPWRANGSLLYGPGGSLQGSEMIAQEFKSERYFWTRPSAVGFNPLPSGGSNLGPTSKALKEKREERRQAGGRGDLLAASASGLDPHISPASAMAQVSRVARARGEAEEEISKLVALASELRQFGFLGENRVNVLKLNRLLDERKP